MCITIQPAKLSNTLIYAGEAYHPEDQRYIHVMAYQNRATNLADRPNAMVLPIPAKAHMGPENTINMVGYEDLLKDLSKPLRNMNKNRSYGSRGITKALVFDVGSYTVVLATRAEDAIDAISEVPTEKRPKLNREVFKAFSEWYPDWPIAICCWNGAIQPEPLLWWYEPLDPKNLFYPAVDAHDGKAPDLKKDVKRDHTLIVGSTIHPFGIHSRVSDLGPAKGFISDSVWGRALEGADFNRDFTVSVPKLRTLENVKGARDMHARLDSNIWDVEFTHYNPARAQ